MDLQLGQSIERLEDGTIAFQLLGIQNWMSTGSW
jgi:hypothetical protein